MKGESSFGYIKPNESWGDLWNVILFGSGILSVGHVYTGPLGGMELNSCFYYAILFKISCGKAATSYLLLA